MPNRMRELGSDPDLTPAAAFGSTLRRYRLKAQLSQRRLGQATHLSTSMIGKFELGERRPMDSTAGTLDRLLGANGELIALARAIPIPPDYHRTPRAPTRTLFGARLRQHRTRAGLSQSALARAVYLTPGMIGLLERGDRRPSRGIVRLLDRALDASGDLIEVAAGEPFRPAAALLDHPADREVHERLRVTVPVRSR